MGFIPKFCRIKTLCQLSNWRMDDEEAIGNLQMSANSKKTMHFISLIKQYQELTLTGHDAIEFLGRRAKNSWGHGEGDLSERSEHKWGVLYQLANYYEKRILNLKRLLKELIETSDQPLTLPMNWDDVMVLHPPSSSFFSEDSFRLRLPLS